MLTCILVSFNDASVGTSMPPIGDGLSAILPFHSRCPTYFALAIVPNPPRVGHDALAAHDLHGLLAVGR